MSLLALAAVTVSLAAPTHTPAVNAKWSYSVRATSAGRALRATITVQIIDPFGTAHPVEYDGTKTPIVNRPFRGVFRDYIRFPSESRRIRLTLRFTVRALGARRVLTYWIRAR